MPRVTIDGKTVEVRHGGTILDAARKLGIPIPTMCYLEGREPAASCMLCVVKISGPDRLVPSCAALAEDGMIVENDCTEVRAARKAALELLLSDHAGDCIAPCRAACPAGIDIPAAIRYIINGDTETNLARTAGAPGPPVPEVPCRTCPAPCEKACRRRLHDAPVSIRLLIMFAAEQGWAPSGQQPATRERKKPWSVHIGKPFDDEMEKFLANASASGRVAPSGGDEAGYTAEEARAEAPRCVECDCPKGDECLLRRYAAEYGAKPRRSPGAERRHYTPDDTHPLVQYDSGKCISCGVCVRIAEERGEHPGLAFLGRGFGARVGVPFGGPLSEALGDAAEACAAACPTGALALRRKQGPDGKE